MSPHMIMAPALESSACVVGVLAVNFNQFVKDTASQVKILISEVFTQNKEHLREEVSSHADCRGQATLLGGCRLCTGSSWGCGHSI